MTIGGWLAASTKRLAGISSARLDSLILLEDALGRDRGWILANPDFKLNAHTLKKLDSKLKRRSTHEPLAYIRGKSEFYGRTFQVTPATLQPRPETETMVELFKKTVAQPSNIIDVGTGSGCLAITLKLELPKNEVYATEINAAALRIARGNAQALSADIKFFKGNLLAPVSPFSLDDAIIVANLPYVPDSHVINQAAMQEPRVAIFGGPDGLDLYRQMFNQIDSLKHKPKYIFTESLPPQHPKLAMIAKKANYEQISEEDFIQLFRLESTG